MDLKERQHIYKNSVEENNVFGTSILRKALEDLGNEMKESVLKRADEVEAMEEDEFKKYVTVVEEQLKIRKEGRNPLTLLRQRISIVMQDRLLSEFEKEEVILDLIQKFYKAAETYRGRMDMVRKRMANKGITE
ncbi:hypothetical protein PJK55_00280 [Exiguobacterium sp. MMG028]|uniref:hypothetical protein n=1 Tax=Exiguobacterium sp. MMG028 TaxID=3021979 RepID=UPI0022FE88E2|nr:hypothetical protein [Exiguobacterium sp. MMG028]MDA5559152.1 hypothetical protein [Exiguobacterium sp. MMG028]